MNLYKSRVYGFSCSKVIDLGALRLRGHLSFSYNIVLLFFLSLFHLSAVAFAYFLVLQSYYFS